MEKMKTRICNCVSEFLEGVSFDEVLALMEVPPEENMGDLALPCHSFARSLHKSPAVIAQELCEALLPKAETLGIERIETVKG